MGAPEKIYLKPLLMEDEESVVRRCTLERQMDSQIEYTRTDAFIEKVKSFLNKKNERDYYTIGYIKRHLEEIIKEIGL